MAQAEMISIGNELLNGRIADTNAQWIGRQLLQIGMPLARVTVIPDVMEIMTDTLRQALSRSQVVLLSGGLGPTQDDLTKPMLAQYFNSRLVLHQPTLDRLNAWIAARGRTLNELNKGQAMLPDTCVVLENAVGTAQGMQFETPDGRLVFSMPGVPHELQHLMTRHILPLLQQRFVTDYLRQHTLRTAAVPESELAQKIAHIENALPPTMMLAYNPSLMTVDLRLALRGPASDKSTLDAEFDRILGELRTLLAPYTYGEQTDTLAGAVGNLLTAKGHVFALAESCTGGALAADFVRQVPGASKFLMGGIVAYDNQVKTALLRVSPDTIAQHGAVSEAVAMQMAKGVAERFGTPIGISTTGIAGPDGGSEAKPVGTVWIGIHSPLRTVAKHFLFERDRARNIQRSVVMAQSLLWHELRKLA